MIIDKHIFAGVYICVYVHVCVGVCVCAYVLPRRQAAPKSSLKSESGLETRIYYYYAFYLCACMLVEGDTEPLNIKRNHSLSFQ